MYVYIYICIYIYICTIYNTHISHVSSLFFLQLALAPPPHLPLPPGSGLAGEAAPRVDPDEAPPWPGPIYYGSG